jgi:hypothetical protein
MDSRDEKNRRRKESAGGNPGRPETGAPPARPRRSSGNSSAPSRRSPYSSCSPRKLRPDAVPVRRRPHGICAAFASGSLPHSQEKHFSITRGISSPPSISSVWHAAAASHPVGSIVRGVVRTFTNYGAFIEIAEGVGGFVYETDPGLVLLGVPDIGDEVKVRVTSFDPPRCRVELGLVCR